MELVLKTRDAWDKDYLFEVHKDGCTHLRFEKMSVYKTDKYATPQELITADAGTDNSLDMYKIMPCVK